MSDKVWLGAKVGQLETGDSPKRISRVTLAADSENVYTAGDDTGRELTANCPWASQAMANAVLAAVGGYDYRPYTAREALLDPAAELGDGVTVGGVYSMIAQVELPFDRACAATVAAPYEDEIDDEYPYISAEVLRTQRQLAQTRSLITKTASEINLKVEQLDGELGQTLRVAADGVTITNADGDTLTINGGQIDASSINTAQLDASKINVDDLALTGKISWGDLDSTTQTTVNNAAQTANAANANAAAASSQVQAWTYGGTTQIDGTKIATGTVRASILAGGAVELLGYNTLGQEKTAGTMTMTPASTSAFAVQLESTGALRLISALGSAAFLGAGGQSGPHGFVQCGYEPGGTTTGVLVGGAQFAPAGSGGMSCGAAAHLWSAVYAQSGTIQTSDLTHKQDVEALPEKYLAMLDAVTPRRFRLKGGTSGRYHVGFIAQEVEAAMAAAGVSDMEFGGWVKDTDEDGNDLYLLRYEEFIALLLEKLRQLEGRLEALE